MPATLTAPEPATATTTTATATTIVHVVPFSHLDLFWTGTREECLSRGNYIIGHALDLLEEYPDFTFLIESVNFLDHYVRCHPADSPRIRKLATSGRLELAPLWSAIYQNLPGGETHARNTLLAKRYVKKHFGCDPDTAHFADLPGYTPQYPQIAKLSGIRNVIMSRGGPKETPLFAWQAPDGSRILSYYVVHGYPAFAMQGHWHKDYEKMSVGPTKTLLENITGNKTHPALIHWGCDLYAPDETVIRNVRRWNREQPATTPRLCFSTLHNYFNEAARAAGLPVLTGELPSAWPNVESAWPDIWPEDLACENALQTAEFLTTLVHLRRDIFPTETYPHRELEDAWRALLDAMDHNQNGQGGDRADRDKLQLKKYSRYAAERIRDNAAWQLAANIPVPDTATFPVVVFNTMSWRRTGVVYARAVVFGVPCSSDATNFFEKGLRLINDRGETVPYVQLSRHEGLSFTMEIAFHADTLPSAGYRTWYLTEGPNPINDATTATVKLDDEAEHADTPENRLYLTSDRTIQLGPRRPLGHDQYQTRHFRILLDRATGDLSIYRRHVNGNKDGAETLLLDRMSIAGVEERRGNYIFAMPASGRTAPAILDSVEILDNNALWFRLRLRGTVYGMRFTQTLILFSHVPEIHLENEIDWTEPRWVRLQQLFPYAASGNTIRYGVPYGQVTYPDVMSASLGKGGDEIDPADRDKLRLCQHWVDIGDDTTGLTIGCDHRMWEFEKTDTETGASAKLLRAYMLRGVGYCFGAARDTDGKLKNTPRPPPGRYTFRYILRPRATSFADSANWRCGWELNCPPHSVTLGGTKPQANHAAPLPATDSLFDFTDTTLVTTAFKKAEDGDAVILRAFETAGRATATPPAVNISRHAVSETNILEETGSPLTPVRPYEIKTLAIITTS